MKVTQRCEPINNWIQVVFNPHKWPLSVSLPQNCWLAPLHNCLDGHAYFCWLLAYSFTALCVYIYIYTHTHLHTCIYIYMYLCTYIHILRTYIYIGTYTYLVWAVNIPSISFSCPQQTSPAPSSPRRLRQSGDRDRSSPRRRRALQRRYWR